MYHLPDEVLRLILEFRGHDDFDFRVAPVTQLTFFPEYTEVTIHHLVSPYTHPPRNQYIPLCLAFTQKEYMDAILEEDIYITCTIKYRSHVKIKVQFEHKPGIQYTINDITYNYCCFLVGEWDQCIFWSPRVFVASMSMKISVTALSPYPQVDFLFFRRNPNKKPRTVDHQALPNAV
jgi:hypothetical protein